MRAGSASPRSRATVRRVAFNRRKYGHDLLLDVAWVHDMPAFITVGPHALDFYDIILITRGEGVFLLDGTAHPVHPGTLLFTAPGQVREWRVRNLDGVCLFFVDAFIGEFLQDDAFLRRLPYFDSDPSHAILTVPRLATTLRRRLTAMRGELASYGRDSLELLRAQVHETLIVLAREYAAAHHVAARRPTNGTVARFVALVERDAARCHRIADFATELGVSPGHLTTLCNEVLGRSAKAHLDESLAIRARRMLLYTGESAARIAVALGFEDASYFSRFFRRMTGLSPSRFRAGAAPPR